MLTSLVRGHDALALVVVVVIEPIIAIIVKICINIDANEAKVLSEGKRAVLANVIETQDIK